MSKKHLPIILLCLAVSWSVSAQEGGKTGKIKTPWGEALNPAAVWSEYPGPSWNGRNGRI